MKVSNSEAPHSPRAPADQRVDRRPGAGNRGLAHGRSGVMFGKPLTSVLIWALLAWCVVSVSAVLILYVLRAGARAIQTRETPVTFIVRGSRT
jgi:hypothetical protein